MMASTAHHWDLKDVSHWARSNGIEIVLIVLGAIILGRIVHWTTRYYVTRVDAEVKQRVQVGGVASERQKRVRAVAQAVEWTLLALIFFISAILIFQKFDLPLTSLVAPATVAGVAIGFGAQQMVADLLAGFFLFSERQFGVGDVIRLSQPGQLTGVTGTVEELTLRVTRLRTVGGEVLFLPNGALRQVTNLSRDWSRVVVDVPVPVTADLDRVTSALRQVLDDMVQDPQWQGVLLGAPVIAGLEDMEVDHYQLRLIARTLPGKQFDAGRELRLRAARALQEEGVSAATVAVADSDG
jgi:small-conductance mechanosensitive channel